MLTRRIAIFAGLGVAQGSLRLIAGVNRGRRTAPWAAGLHARLLWPLYGPLAMRAVARRTATARPQLPHHGIATSHYRDQNVMHTSSARHPHEIGRALRDFTLEARCG